MKLNTRAALFSWCLGMAAGALIIDSIDQRTIDALRATVTRNNLLAPAGQDPAIKKMQATVVPDPHPGHTPGQTRITIEAEDPANTGSLLEGDGWATAQGTIAWVKSKGFDPATCAPAHVQGWLYCERGDLPK